MLFEEAKVCDEEYAEYLDHNELELAMNALDDLGLLCGAPNEFWHQLASAASNMGLADDVERFKMIKRLNNLFQYVSALLGLHRTAFSRLLGPEAAGEFGH